MLRDVLVMAREEKVLPLLHGPCLGLQPRSPIPTGRLRRHQQGHQDLSARLGAGAQPQCALPQYSWAKATEDREEC